MPVEVNEHVLWCGEVSHGPPGKRRYLMDYGLRKSQRAMVRRVHVFCQQFWLEGWNDRGQWHDFCRSWSEKPRTSSSSSRQERRKSSVIRIETEQPIRVGELGGRRRPSDSINNNNTNTDSEHEEEAVPSHSSLQTLRITIRHTDWWYHLLGERSPLALDPFKAGRAKPSTYIPTATPEPGSWGTRFVYFHTLKIFELELETTVGKKAELEDVVAHARRWRFALGNGDVLIWDGGRSVERSTWRGRRVGGKRRGGEGLGDGDGDGGEEGKWEEEYFVVVLAWRAVRKEEGGEIADGEAQGMEEEEEQPADGNNASPAVPVAPAEAAMMPRGRDAVSSYYG